jgi:hypothetical protein
MTEIVLLGSMLLFITGVAVFALMRINRPGGELRSYSTQPQQTTEAKVDLDTDDLAEKIGKVVARELAKSNEELLEKLLAKMPRGGYLPSGGTSSGYHSDDDDMDKIIPVSVKMSGIETNLENMAKEEKTKDESLSASKSKLKGILKGRKK